MQISLLTCRAYTRQPACAHMMIGSPKIRTVEHHAMVVYGRVAFSKYNTKLVIIQMVFKQISYRERFVRIIRDTSHTKFQQN